MNNIESTITVKKATQSRLHTDSGLASDFGKIVSDHMFTADYADGRWSQPEIIPYGDFSIAPTALGLHYGQTVFEGMKAFRMIDDKKSIFRMDKHYQRLCKSLDRMCMPVVPPELFNDGLRELVSLDEAWVPSAENGSLYIRPFMFATEARFGVKVSDEYKFMIFTGPVGPYYTKSLRVKVETEFTRAAKGGTGDAKCGGNYGAAFYPTQQARAQGFDQVLWTDAENHEFIEESGTMNIVFLIDDVLITPALCGTILDGVTRDSVLQIARDMDIKIQERRISYIELKQALVKGIKMEAFGVGTAAVTAPIATIHMEGTDYRVTDYTDESFCNKAARTLTDIRSGKKPDLHKWNTIVE